MDKKSKNVKLSSTAYRVLLILLLLNARKHSIDELIESLANNKIISRTFSKEAVVKYINTLKLSGFEILKTIEFGTSYYHLKKAPFQMQFNDNELKTLAVTQNHVSYLYQPHLISNFQSLMDKVKRYLPEDDIEVMDNYQQETGKLIDDNYFQFAHLIRRLEEYCLSRQTVAVSYSPLQGLKQKIILEPEKIEYLNSKVYLYGNNPGIHQKQHLQLDYITNIKQLPSKSRQMSYDYNVTFMLTGKLARSYRLYEREEIIEQGKKNSYLVISANVADLDVMLHRLLRYGHYCEVLSPANARKKMSEIIDYLLECYDDKLA